MCPPKADKPHRRRANNLDISAPEKLGNDDNVRLLLDEESVARVILFIVVPIGTDHAGGRMNYYYEEAVIISIILGGGRIATATSATAAAAASYCHLFDYLHRSKKSKEEEEGNIWGGEILDIDHGCVWGASFLVACWTIFRLFRKI